MLTIISSVLFDAYRNLLLYVSSVLLFLSFFLSLAYSCGWIHRYLWWFVETQAGKILNGTPVTVGHLEVDFLRGKVWASNVVLHAPQRERWQWQSPLLARIGKVYVECNILHLLLGNLLWKQEPPPLELDTVHMSDIQAFLERKQHIFNVHLLDPHNVLPDPQDLVVPTKGHVTEVPTLSMEEEESSTVVNGDEEAQAVVNELMKAVKSIGRAARKGSLNESLVEHRQVITTKLKELQNSKKSEAMQKGVEIVQQVSKAVVEKTHTAQQVVQPARQPLPEDNQIIYVRVGRFVVEEARIFTKDHWQDTAVWNKPIVIQRLTIRAAEFCPPFAAQDEHDYPALYQPMDKCLDVIFKRLLAEMAKSNTGRFVHSALGEVMDLFKDNES